LNLRHLKNFPFDAIKIDQSFVKDIGNNDTDSELIKAIIAMAHSLKMTTIAEGVESKEQCEFLEEQQCDEMQGFYFSHPLPASRFESMLRNQDTVHSGRLPNGGLH
jgi:EAL domain-containing protein (putative c-di-GMP-specific phosphodiesterase class I)